jgi:hypothetical protein
MFLALGERVLYDSRMARRRQLRNDAILQSCLVVADGSRIVANLLMSLSAAI